jgi:peptide/nickel transport system substrate-binding protein
MNMTKTQLATDSFAIRLGRLAWLAIYVLIQSATSSIALARSNHGALPEYGGTLIRRLAADVTTLNPVRDVTLNDRYVAAYLFTPLIHLDQSLQPMPALATSWKMSKDGRIYRFELNERATFVDGTPVLAGDVIFTLRKAIDLTSAAPQSAASFEDLDLEHTRVINDHVVEVSFRKHDASQLTEFNRLMVVPEHVYGKGRFSDDFNERAIGSGPYELVKWDRGKQIELRRRATYWAQIPYIQTVIFKVLGNDTTAWNAIRLGQLDETLVSSERWFRERANPDLRGKVTFRTFYTLNYNFIAWNVHRTILADSRVRRAIAMCIPIDSVIANVYHGAARRLSGPFMPGTYAYNPNVPPVPYHPEEAIKLLTSLGWADRNRDGFLERSGKALAFEMLIDGQNEADKELAQIIKEELGRVGIDMTIVPIEYNTLVQRVLSGDYDAAQLGKNLGPEPEPFGAFHSSQQRPVGMNFAGYHNDEVDRLIEDAQHEVDRGKRATVYRRLHEILASEQPYTWTMQVEEKWAISTRVRGVDVSKGYGLFRWYPGELAWWIPKQYQTDWSSTQAARLTAKAPTSSWRRAARSIAAPAVCLRLPTAISWLPSLPDQLILFDTLISVRLPFGRQRPRTMSKRNEKLALCRSQRRQLKLDFESLTLWHRHPWRACSVIFPSHPALWRRRPAPACSLTFRSHPVLSAPEAAS